MEQVPPKPSTDGGGELIDRYRSYVAAFNAKDFTQLAQYVAEDVYFERGNWPPLDGRDAFFAFYAEAFTHLRERVSVERVTTDHALLDADIIVELDIFNDWLDFPGGPLLAGQRKTIRDAIRYTFRHGLIVRIEPRES